jgi:hypothetical protein
MIVCSNTFRPPALAPSGRGVEDLGDRHHDACATAGASRQAAVQARWGCKTGLVTYDAPGLPSAAAAFSRIAAQYLSFSGFT